MSSIAASILRTLAISIESIADVVAVAFGQERAVRALFYKLIDDDVLGVYSHGITDTELLVLEADSLQRTKPMRRLPPSLLYMSEARKSVIRTSYDRAVRTFAPGSSQLPLAQRRLARPIRLSGRDASINVALRPMAAHISLGHEYEATVGPCPSPRMSRHMNSRVEVMATLDGATHVLNALIRGEVTKEWLKSPGDLEEEVSALLMRRSIAMRPYRDAQGINGPNAQLENPKPAKPIGLSRLRRIPRVHSSLNLMAQQTQRK